MALKFALFAGVAVLSSVVMARADTISPSFSLTALPNPGGTIAPVALSTADLGTTPFTTGTGTDAVNVTFQGVASNQGVVQGTVANLHADPITDAAGDPYTGPYFSTGANPATITLSFASSQKYLGLLWGSVDTTNENGQINGPNIITFYNGATQVAAFTADQLATAAGVQLSGSQGFGGSYYLLLNDTTSGGTFNRVVLSSGIVSFESAEYEFASTNVVVPSPEPAVIAVLGTGLLGLAMARRRA